MKFRTLHYVARNATLRLVKKTKGFLIVPVDIDDPSFTRRLAIARRHLGRNARVVTVLPASNRDYWRALARAPRRLFIWDEASWAMSSSPALVADATLLEARLPRLHEALAQIDRLREQTNLRLPAWIFLSRSTIITEEEARRDVARAPSVIAEAQKVRERDRANLAAIYNLGRRHGIPPVVVEQSLSEANG